MRPKRIIKKKKMSPNSLKNLRSIPKGTVLNPEGGRLHNPMLRALRKVTTQVYTEIINLALTSNMIELDRIANDPKSSAVQAGVARAMWIAVLKGDWSVINGIAERLVGKIPDKLELSGSVNNPMTARNFSDEELLAILKSEKNDDDSGKQSDE